MSKALALNLQVIPKGTFTNTTGLTNAAAQIGVGSNGSGVTLAFANGTGLNQADVVWQSERTLATSTSENLDLAGVLTDEFGATATFARIKMIFIWVKTATAGYTLEVGGAATNAFVNWVKDATDIVVVRGGGVLLIGTPDATGYAVTAATGDILKINNPSGGSVTYDIIIIGASA